jgi:tetratricopeptide (TPR) repeat protein
MADLELARDAPGAAAKILAGLEKPDDPDSLEIRARVALRSGESAQARKLAVTLRAREEAGAAAMIEAEAFAREKKREAALVKFREAFAVLGDGARAQAAAILREAGLPAEGEELLRAWVKERPADPLARFRLGSYLERTGAFAQSESEMREAIRLDGEFAEALNHLGYAMIDRNLNVDEGLGLVRRALALDPENGAYLDSLGWGLHRLGRHQEARGPLERAAREFPRDATVLEHLGDVYEKLGERARARALWRRALDADPDDRAQLERKLRPAGPPSADPR